ILDNIGGYMTYGQCETSAITHEKKLLPMGLAKGCKLKRDIRKDDILTYADVTLPEGRFSDWLRFEQNKYFNITDESTRMKEEPSISSYNDVEYKFDDEDQRIAV